MSPNSYSRAFALKTPPDRLGAPRYRETRDCGRQTIGIRRLSGRPLLAPVVGVYVLAFLSPSHAYEVNDKLSITGVVAGALQYQSLAREDEGKDESGGAIPFQPQLDFRPTDVDQLSVKLGFAAGNGLNDKAPFTLAPWAADLEDDVKDINGSGRDYLLTAWYQRLFKTGDEGSLSLTGGLIDATDYLDQNAYANDEYNQFMNEALVNSTGTAFPSYDLGGALQWSTRNVGVKGVLMNVNGNDDGNNYWFMGMELAYAVDTTVGKGNYRIIVDATSKEFSNPAGTRLERRAAILLSFDQEFGEIFGGFLRLGSQTQDGAVDFGAVYSGGVNISGKLWRRPKDNLGIGYAYLSGGNTGIDRTQVFEAYARFVPKSHFAVTLDLQYMSEELDAGGGPKGWIPGIRLTGEF